ncbi:amidohydrolase [Galbibacter sp. EGI 63066]|uniref:amidohydrolase n=1 Tax=Galbibacter sp. EGI 63066 TaxID=2993559 RepID=UPI002249618D|nr:amidohydrolase [Galbibacter sp. EGI 63066]MCX2680541.1 amidohydrolase [Galbibacter sp. EGI 63066]
MLEQLHIALIQTPLVWEKPKENRKVLQQKIEAVTPETDLIVLPEMFPSGFTMNPAAVFETMDGKTVSWLQQWAKKKDAAIMGSVVIKENDCFYNRLLFVKPDGSVLHYDKRHTFTLAKEDEVYAKGNHKVIIDYKGWKICPQICYDLRFPVWSRNVEDYDVLIYVANWPKKRIQAWDVLLQARAIENMSYCIGVNRVGLDGNDYEYSGHSTVYDALGKQLTYSETEETLYATLDKSELKKYREKLKFLSDRDSFTIK